MKKNKKETGYEILNVDFATKKFLLYGSKYVGICKNVHPGRKVAKPTILPITPGCEEFITLLFISDKYKYTFLFNFICNNIIIAFISIFVAPIIYCFINIKFLITLPLILCSIPPFINLFIIITAWNKENRRIFSAMNAVVNAYNKENRIPTLEEAEKSSNVSFYNSIFVYARFLEYQIIAVTIFILFQPSGLMYLAIQIVLFILLLNMPRLFQLVELIFQLALTDTPKQNDLVYALHILTSFINDDKGDSNKSSNKNNDHQENDDDQEDDLDSLLKRPDLNVFFDDDEDSSF